MRLVLVLAALAVVGCKGERAGQEERCIAFLKKEEKCVPFPTAPGEAPPIETSTDGPGYSRFAAKLCVHQFDDPTTLDGADQRIAARYATLMACSEKTTTCDEYMACACQDPTMYVQCKK